MSDLIEPYRRKILVELLRRTCDMIEADDDDRESQHGVEFSVSRWFGSWLLDHERMRFRRALRDLVAGGYVTPWARWGSRVTHLAITADGERMASEFTEDETHEHEAT